MNQDKYNEAWTKLMAARRSGSSDRINLHPHVLHLWKYRKADFPMPDKCYV